MRTQHVKDNDFKSVIRDLDGLIKRLHFEAGDKVDGMQRIHKDGRGVAGFFGMMKSKIDSLVGGSNIKRKSVFKD